MNFDVILTDEMSDLEKHAAIAAFLSTSYDRLVATPEWQLLMGGLERKVEALSKEIIGLGGKLDQRDEDRKRGQIAAFSDVIATAHKARLLAEQLTQQAANDKERTNARERADRGDYGDELASLPGFGSF